MRVYPAASSGVPNMVALGVVEDPETGETQAFRDSEELWRIVSRPPSRDSVAHGSQTDDGRHRDSSDG